MSTPKLAALWLQSPQGRRWAAASMSTTCRVGTPPDTTAPPGVAVALRVRVGAVHGLCRLHGAKYRWLNDMMHASSACAAQHTRRDHTTACLTCAHPVAPSPGCREQTWTGGSRGGRRPLQRTVTDLRLLLRGDQLGLMGTATPQNAAAGGRTLTCGGAAAVSRGGAPASVACCGAPSRARQPALLQLGQGPWAGGEGNQGAAAAAGASDGGRDLSGGDARLHISGASMQCSLVPCTCAWLSTNTQIRFPNHAPRGSPGLPVCSHTALRWRGSRTGWWRAGPCPAIRTGGCEREATRQ